jgi:general secretion pathway protein E
VNAVHEQAALAGADMQRHIAEARAQAQRGGKRLLESVEERYGQPPAEFTAALGAALQYPVLTMEALHQLEPAFDLLPFTEALQHECVLLRDAEGNLLLAFADPFDARLRAWAGERMRRPVTWHLVHHADLAACLARQEETMHALDSSLSAGASAEGAASTGVEKLSLRSISEDTSAVVKLVNSTLYDALKSGASDIHLEATASGLVMKYRVDGVLALAGSVHGTETAEQVISRVKVMSELDIAERRVPQDGRFKVSARGREIDIRVSVMPSIFGEDAVLRILDKQNLADEVKGLRLDRLGFDSQPLAFLRRLSNEPYGMLLVTGPTGSGKTTTLYAAVTEINNGRDKIITIEDPVEYQLPGVLQIPVNEKKGLTFARGLRSILRHDPDKILVGEIRDAETAQIAIQAALTGHLVFTTVHANNVFDVLGRFTHMGVDPYSFVSALNGVMAQRLVRLNCPHCSERVQPSEQLLRESGLDPAAVEDYEFRAGRGCGQCRGSGYRGRSAIAETLLLNDELRELIASREPIRKIKVAAQASGTHFLREAALRRVQSGATSLEEINRVTFIA